jgi:uncharacterized protein YdcH (DUF465 family)
MSHVPHELAEDFPAETDLIHRLKTEDAHFATLAERYHEVNRAVHRAETDVEPMGDAQIAALRRERMQIKDEVAALLAKARD